MSSDNLLFFKEYEVILWNCDQDPPKQFKSKFEITCTNGEEIMYSFEGAILRVDKIYAGFKEPEVLTNLEQIKNLQWIGQYDQNNLKIGPWQVLWKYEQLTNVGGEYSKQGNKQGQWKEIIQNYWSKAQVYEAGEYINHQRQGFWKYIYEDKDLGGGEYNEQGKRNGKWIHLSDAFWAYSQVIYQGEYLNGQKIGRWDILYKQRKGKDFELIGGGNYDEDGNGKRIGEWIELNEGFWDYSQVIYKGKYSNNNKIGRWDILSRKKGEQLFLSIGGGLYCQSCSLQIGRWVEPRDGFGYQQKIVFEGQYHNGKRVGLWNIINLGIHNKFEKIGGGLYDSVRKVGKWIELSDEFEYNSQVIYEGEYRNDQKIGIWHIFHREKEQQQFQQIGGGAYDKTGQGFKIGSWVELSDKFINKSQVSYLGEYRNNKKIGKWNIFSRNMNFQSQKIGDLFYNFDGKPMFGTCMQLNQFLNSSYIASVGKFVDGKKVGQWDILCRSSHNEPFQKIGGGEFHSTNYGIKIGKWIELSGYFSYKTQVTYDGEYDNGIKVGLWKVYNQKKLSGCLNYDQRGRVIYKSGHPLDVINIGEFTDGKKVGRWDILLRRSSDQEYLLIGGGQYEEGNYGKKIGKWIELGQMFSKHSQITYHGEYLNGNKVGNWQIFFQLKATNTNKLIGGGQYDEENCGLKIGNWIELSDKFNQYSKLTYYGQYDNSIKVGLWKEYNGKKLRGCLNYDLGGNIIYKSGHPSNLIEIGEFIDGKKVGKWDILQRSSNNKPYKLIGGGSYDEANQGNKIGKWIEITEQFNDNYLAIQEGEYNNDKKVGLWITTNQSKQFCECINYDCLDSHYIKSEENNNLIYNGLLNNGKKVGRWNLFYWNYSELELIGGGSYQMSGDEFKIGMWIEFRKLSSGEFVTDNGHYEYGKKVGLWQIFYKGEQIGGGQYDKGGIEKIGKWIEVNEGYYQNFQVVDIGEYQNGRKLGKWEICLRKLQNENFQLIGGGVYDFDSSIKTGQWIELDNNFEIESQFIQKGQYKNNQKIGRWDILFRDKDEIHFEKFGGGVFDECGDGSKQGKWIEIDLQFGKDVFFFQGEYKNSVKVGVWNIYCYSKEIKQNILVTLGVYDSNQRGIKIGKWSELKKDIFSYRQSTSGEYKNGKKVGIWEVKMLCNPEIKFEISYDI